MSHFILGIVLIMLIYRHDNNMNKEVFSKIFLLILSLYLTESMVQLIVLIVPGLVDIVYVDYLVLICTPLFYMLINNISTARARKVLEEDFNIDKNDPYKSIFYVEQLYMAFLRQAKD